MGKCQFKCDWLNKTDESGYQISRWAKKFSDSELFCVVCDCKVKVSKGFQSVRQHAAAIKHKDNARVKLTPAQLQLSGLPVVPQELLPTVPQSIACENSEKSVRQRENATSPLSLRLYSVRDSATTAELIWAMKVVACNFAAASTQGLENTFAAMFPNALPKGFSLSPKKLSYIITDALGPYFRQKIIDDVQKSCYTLSYDETTNHAGMKELQTNVRFWSEDSDEIVTHHLETFFLGHATADDLYTNLLMATSNAQLLLQHLLMLGSDGPNVNKKVFRLMNEELISVRKKGLINIGTCNLHVVHNAFLKGIEELGEDASDLVLAVYYFFHGWPTRCEDFSKILRELGLPEKHFIKHVTSRWLTLESSATRLLELWDAAERYFLKYVPQHQHSLMSSDRYKGVCKLLKRPTMKAELKFVVSSAKLFANFSRMFQKEEPLVHVLYSELTTLVQTLFGRICTQAAMETYTVSEQMLVGDSLLPVKEVVYSEEVRSELSKLKELDQLLFCKQAQKHYIAVCRHVMKTALGSARLLQNFRCLHPSERKSKRSCADIVKVAQALPFDVPLDTILDEWKLLQREPEPALADTPLRIDHYWRHFFHKNNSFGNPKYPNVARVVKSSLALSHGSADVERGFSCSGRVLSEDRASMSVRMLNARLAVSDGLKKYRNKPELVLITRELLTLAQNAHKSYQNYLQEEKRARAEKEKKKKEEEEQKAEEEEKRKKGLRERKDIEKVQTDLVEKRKRESAKRKAADKLFVEANTRLKKALEKKDMEEAHLAQAMLEGVKLVRSEENKQKLEADSLQKELEKRKSSLLTSFFEKRPRKM